MSIVNPVYYAPPQGSFNQVLGHGIARYGFISFVNSNRVASDLAPYVESNLPPKLKSLSAAYAAQRKKRQRKRWSKKQILARFFQIIPAAFNTIDQSGKLLLSPFVSIADIMSGKVPGKGELLQDKSWGVATVKTDSLQGDLLWSTTVNLGSSMQPLRVNIDTGSADFFVFDPKCSSCALDENSAYVYGNSNTFLPFLNLTFNENYADGGEVDGYLALDDLSLGGQVTVSNQTFGLATTVSSHWQSLGVDGLMGLGFDSLSSFPLPHNRGVFTQLIDTGALSQPVIGIALSKAKSNYSGGFAFGEIDGQWIRGGVSNMLWKNVSSQNFWGTELSGIYINGQNVMASSDPPRAIVDTGTSLMLVSTETAAGIHSKIPGAVMNPSNGVWRLPCSPAGASDATSSSPLNFFHAPPVASTSSTKSPAPFNFFGSSPAASTSTNPSSTSASNNSGMGSLFNKIFSIFKRSTSMHQRSAYHRAARARKATTSTPNVFIELGSGSRKFGIPASDLAYQAIPSNDPNSKASDGRTAMCYSGIQSGADGFFVLGGTFIKNHYIALQRQGLAKSIGFGDRVDIPVMN